MEKLFEGMDIPETDKVELQEAFDKAVLKKTTEMIDEHVDSLVTEKVEALEEEYKEKVVFLEDSLDGYLDTVVEDFITENAPVYEAEINEAKAKTLLEKFDEMATIMGIDMLKIQEAKEEKDDEDEEEEGKSKEELEDKLSEMAERVVEAKREADKYLQAGVVKEVSEGLSVLETAKFEKLAEMVPFEREPSYLEKLEVIKEQIMDSRADDFDANIELPGSAFRHDKQPDVADALNWKKYV